MKMAKWNLNGHSASLVANDFRIEVDCSRPDLGFAASRSSNEEGLGRFFKLSEFEKIETPTEIECFTRGKDLITRYESNSNRPVGCKLYWRFHEYDNHVASVEFIHSSQTHLLNERPAPRLICELIGTLVENSRIRSSLEDDLIREDSGNDQDNVFLSEVGGGAHCLICVYPNDLDSIAIEESNDSVQLHLGLRSGFLEKGVIRRNRVLALFGAKPETSKNDLKTIAQKFVDSSLPLTV